MAAPRYASSRDYPAKRDEQGNRLCRYCAKPVKPPKRSWCSKDCVDEYLVRSNPATARSKVFARDKGVCAKCGFSISGQLSKENEIELAAMGFDLPEHTSWWKHCDGSEGWIWQMDHILPVAHGGGACGLENLQTLCTPCHKAKTAKQARGEL